MTDRQAGPQRLMLLPWLAALAAGALMWALTYQLEAAENDRHQTRVRGQVLLKLSALRADLESTLNRLAYIDESIALYVSLNPTITQQRYELLARSIMNGVAGVNHLALIKGTTIKNIYPFAQNMRAIGLDLLNNPETAQAMQKVMASRKPVLAGPLEDKGNDYPGVFIVLRPIYLAAGTAYAAKGSYLGVCAVVIDQKYVYRSAGLETKYSQLNIAIKGSNAQGEAGGMFYGSADVFAMEPVKQKVSVPGREWVIAAAPKAGWGAGSPAVWHIRWLNLLVILTSALLTWFLVRNPIRLRMMVREATAALEDARDNLEKRVALRTNELEKTNRELQEAIGKVKTLSGLLPICASCKKVRDDQGYWSQIEDYVKQHSDADFSHSICPECMQKLYPEVYERIKEKERDS